MMGATQEDTDEALRNAVYHLRQARGFLIQATWGIYSDPKYQRLVGELTANSNEADRLSSRAENRRRAFNRERSRT